MEKEVVEVVEEVVDKGVGEVGKDVVERVMEVVEEEVVGEVVYVELNITEREEEPRSLERSGSTARTWWMVQAGAWSGDLVLGPVHARALCCAWLCLVRCLVWWSGA